jgi:intraflagellar transport protein 20
VSQLNDIVKETVESVDRQAARTEREKLRAVGKRNQVAADAEQRRRKKAELASLRLEKQAELDRLQAEYDSLLRVRQEQEALIAKLSDSSS